jgi:hypothetical protein
VHRLSSGDTSESAALSRASEYEAPLNRPPRREATRTRCTTSSTFDFVAQVYPPTNSGERVTDIALDLLDELRLTLMECLLVLKMLPSEANLNFVDLEQQILLTHHYAKQAHHAASLVNQGATLNARWGESLSRPKAVFARHNAAVQLGARQLRPLPMISDEFEERLWKLPAVNSTVAEPDSAATSLGECLIREPHHDGEQAISATTAAPMSQESLGRTVAEGWRQRHAHRQRRIVSLGKSASVGDPGKRHLSLARTASSSTEDG